MLGQSTEPLHPTGDSGGFLPHTQTMPPGASQIHRKGANNWLCCFKGIIHQALPTCCVSSLSVGCSNSCYVMVPCRPSRAREPCCLLFRHNLSSHDSPVFNSSSFGLWVVMTRSAGSGFLWSLSPLLLTPSKCSYFVFK